jgi:hypothetical protein
MPAFIARRYSSLYELLIVTELDPSIPLGPDRDADEFRRKVAEKIYELILAWRRDALHLTSTNAHRVEAEILNKVLGGL